MADGRDARGAQHIKDGLYIYSGGLEQRLAEGAAELRLIALERTALHVEHAAHEGEAVGVHARGGQGYERIALAHCGAVEYLLPVDEADGKAREVIFVLGVEARHLGGLAADEGGPGLDAALGHACDDVGYALRHILAAGDVVEEEERRGAGADNVIDAHGDAVYAHGVVLVHEEGYLELGAHAVRAGDEHGGLHTRELRLEQPAEAAEPAYDAGRHGALYVLFHQLHGLVACGDVHARGLVACALAFHSSSSLRLIFCSNLDF